MTARVVGQTDDQGNERTECAALVLSSMYNAPFTISIGYSVAEFRQPIMNSLRVVIGPNYALMLEQTRRKIIKYLGNNNVLVDIHVR